MSPMDGATIAAGVPSSMTGYDAIASGFLGSLFDIKGVQLVLRAVRQLRAEGFIDFVVEVNGGNLDYATEACRAEIESFLNQVAV